VCDCIKKVSRLHFLEQLKPAGTPTTDLLYFYTAIVWPVLEYACPVWHCSLTAAQCMPLKWCRNRSSASYTLMGTTTLCQLLLALIGCPVEEKF